ncbi:amino acid permease [Neobacillus ginsengisoli]|uniref:Arginine:ornithine antiporter/lysine permease n=1 Tax=Neobacillus ginsengisoli TaxID=904295 RepID=A0ABT9Y010_9BACI|nr:amino acid permease [Neobacillus ginsengisoli]MDQ0201084.1 arginine:ornithine antiporter/lysine permease [Neobacillus ginsengisoli]
MKDNKLGLWLLTALVVGNMVGSGIFMLPQSLAKAASPGGVLLAWLVTGAGVLMLSLVFGNLSLRKPELNGGVQMYAQALFSKGSRSGVMSGYVVSWGYWIANVTGNVAVLTTFIGYLSTFFPIMTSSAKLFMIGSLTVKVGGFITLIISTIVLWVINAIILRGIERTGQINFVATATKVIGFLIFICFTLFAFQKTNLFPLVQPRISDSGAHLGLFGQVNNAAVTTLWAFVGIESAVMFSKRARKIADIKKATVLGLVISLVIYVGITMLVMGSLTQTELINANKPLVDALQKVVGHNISYVMAIFDLMSLTGTTIGWIFLSAEAPYQAAKQGLFPPIFRKENKNGVPSASLIITNAFSQVFLFLTISDTLSNAYNFVVLVATLAYLVPYAATALYQVKLVLSGDTYKNGKGRVADGIISVLATVYSIYVIIAGTSNMKTFLLGIALYAVGIILFPLLMKLHIKESVNAGHKAA